MGDTVLFFNAVYMLIICIFASVLMTAVYSYRIYRSFNEVEDAMNAYRRSCTHAFSHRIMRITIMVISLCFAAWVVIKRNTLRDDRRLVFIHIAVLLVVIAADLFVFPSAKDTMARARIFSHIRNKYSLKDSIINDWYVDLDEEEYPEELEIDIYESGGERCFIIDLQHMLIREESPYNR